MEYTARMNEHALVSRAAAAGSCVLLKNVENTLPFAGTKDEPVRVAVFGIGQIFTPTGLTGMEPWRKIGILDGLTAEPTVKPDALLAHKYRAWALEHPDGSELPLGSLSMEEFASMNDAAMIVLARSAAHYDPKLTSFEQDMLKKGDRCVLPRRARHCGSRLHGADLRRQEAAAQSSSSALPGRKRATRSRMSYPARSARPASCRSAGRRRWNRSALPRSSLTASSATAILTPTAEASCTRSATASATARQSSAR